MLIATFVILLLFFFLLPLSALAADYPSRVVGISDGDTFTVLTAQEKQVEIRLRTVDDDSAVAWSEWLGMMTPATRRNLTTNLAPGSRGHEIYPDLEVKPEDEVVLKYRFSAFLQGASDLPQRLRAQGYDTVLIAGTVTNVCCESSARDAMMLNFKTIMVSDANAARTDEEHNATLSTFLAIFGDVMDTDFLIQRLETNAALRVAAE